MKMPFGEHMGTKVVDLPDHYLDWISTNMRLRGTLKTEVSRERLARAMKGSGDGGRLSWRQRPDAAHCGQAGSVRSIQTRQQSEDERLARMDEVALMEGAKP